VEEPEVDLLPISALQHLRFCPRQCAFIHIERLWIENRLTAEGRAMHEAAHEPGTTSRGGVRTVRALPLRSRDLGLQGVADVVEFHRTADGREMPLPVEYKRGKPKEHNADAIQLCAQALCLEEMFGVGVPEGALFYGQTKRRLPVAFDQALRDETRRLAAGLRALFAAGRTPPPEYAPRCHQCSFFDHCKPQAIVRSASAYVARLIAGGD
jgi:CRISPR-associated exonuclease Cas4